MIFTGHTAAGGDMASLRLGIDGVSQATPLDTFKTSCMPDIAFSRCSNCRSTAACWQVWAGSG